MSRRPTSLERRYGITRAQYNEALRLQDGVCALCSRPPKARRLHTDHDHKTKRVRGLLCFRCNRALPNYVDGEWLRKAAEYVESEFDIRNLKASRKRSASGVGADLPPPPTQVSITQKAVRGKRSR